jgi:uncharacterized protein YndB with AHSA1/START domain
MTSSVHSSIVINRPIEDVFAVLTNGENTGKWFAGLESKKSEMIGLARRKAP